MRNTYHFVKQVAHRATEVRDILGAMPKKSKDSGHPFPVPPWWWLRASEIRDSMTDPAFITAIRSATGRTYTKFQVTRYFQEDKPSTTLELTRDIWIAFRTSRGLPRPFWIAETPDDAALIEARVRQQLDADAANLSSDLHAAASVSQPPPIQSDGEGRGRSSGPPARRRQSAARR